MVTEFFLLTGFFSRPYLFSFSFLSLISATPRKDGAAVLFSRFFFLLSFFSLFGMTRGTVCAAKKNLLRLFFFLESKTGPIFFLGVAVSLFFFFFGFSAFRFQHKHTHTHTHTHAHEHTNTHTGLSNTRNTH